MSRFANTPTIGTAKAIMLLVLAPARLIGHSVEHAIASQPSIPTPDVEAGLRAYFDRNFSKSVNHLRKSLFLSGILVFAALGAALLSGCLSRQFGLLPSRTALSVLQYMGIGILLWATLARGESPIQTLEGNTLPERADFWLYRGLYVVG